MDGGVVYAAWLAGRWQLIAMDRPRRVARLSIGGRDVAARGGTYSTVAVGWADSFTERKRWRCQTREDSVRQAAVGGRSVASGVLCSHSAGHEWRGYVWQEIIGTTAQAGGIWWCCCGDYSHG